MKKVKIEDNDAQTPDEILTNDTAANDASTESLEATQTPAAQSETTQSRAVEPNAATNELLNDLQRTRADFENYRKQVESQKAFAMSAAQYATVEKFLPLVDDFERALSTYPEQLAPLRKNFDKTLSTLGLARIASEPGVEFNPDLHEAVSVEDDEGDTEVIAETLRPGYLYNGSVIRAAMVKVKHQ